jgi:23S rRNA pseudouridine1911/1915/1917 synthase
MRISVREEGDLLSFLAERLGVSRTRVRKMVKHGAVHIDGQPMDPSNLSLHPGQTIEIHRPAAAAPFPILYEDLYLLAGEKPPGLLSVSTERENSNTFYRMINEYLRLRSHGKERVFIVHRLDREASGIMLFAKSQAVQEMLQRQWAETEKRYYAVVEGHPPESEGCIKSWLKENRIHKVYSSPERSQAKYAVTLYREVKRYPRHSFLEVRLQTGRKNQIRVHLSDLGCPIVGDKRYGASENPFRRLALHAFCLSFTHPISKKRITLKSPLPQLFSSPSMTP